MAYNGDQRKEWENILSKHKKKRKDILRFRFCVCLCVRMCGRKFRFNFLCDIEIDTIEKHHIERVHVCCVERLSQDPVKASFDWSSHRASTRERAAAFYICNYSTTSRTRPPPMSLKCLNFIFRVARRGPCRESDFFRNPVKHGWTARICPVRCSCAESRRLVSPTRWYDHVEARPGSRSTANSRDLCLDDPLHRDFLQPNFQHWQRVAVSLRNYRGRCRCCRCIIVVVTKRPSRCRKVRFIGNLLG